MSIGILVGTRPEIIKISPVLRRLEKLEAPFQLIHSNQHYSSEMDAIFFEQLQIPTPHHNLNAGSSNHAEQTAKIMVELNKILVKDDFDVLVVHGDTNTALAGALVASKLNIPVIHIEAGLRSFDRQMPEEVNRVLVDHMSEILFSVTDLQTTFLLNEGIPGEKIFEVGNTITDALHWALQNKPTNLIQPFDTDNYCVATLHRPSNVDTEDSLINVLHTLKKIAVANKVKVIWPVHPRTSSMLKKIEIEDNDWLKIVPPCGYFEFLKLLQEAHLIVTDSGGVQEEACILGIPCLTYRGSTERQETLKIGANRLIHSQSAIADLRLDFTELQIESESSVNKWTSPYKSGASEKIVSTILKYVASTAKKSLSQPNPGHEHTLTQPYSVLSSKLGSHQPNP